LQEAKAFGNGLTGEFVASEWTPQDSWRTGAFLLLEGGSLLTGKLTAHLPKLRRW
jgi:hypothetical protein